MKTLEKTLFLTTALLLPLAGCVLHGTPDRNSRFSTDISTMEKMEQTSDFPQVTWVYRHPTRKPTDFTKFIISPFKIYENTAKKIQPEDRRTFDALGATLRERLVKLVGKDYYLTDKPDPATLRIDIDIVDIKPFVQMEKDGNDTTVLNPSMKGSKLEASCYDAMTNELIYAVSTLYKGDAYTAYQDPSLIDNLKTAFAEWSVYFKKKFDEAMTYK